MIGLAITLPVSARADQFNSSPLNTPKSSILGQDPSICNDPQIKQIEARTGTTARVFPPGPVSRSWEIQGGAQPGVCAGTNGIVEFIPTDLFNNMKRQLQTPKLDEPLKGGIQTKQIVKPIKPHLKPLIPIIPKFDVPVNPIFKPLIPKIAEPVRPRQYPAGADVYKPIEGGSNYYKILKTEFLCAAIDLFDQTGGKHFVKFRVGPQFQANHGNKESMGEIMPENNAFIAAWGYMSSGDVIFLDAIEYGNGLSTKGIAIKLRPCKPARRSPPLKR